MEEKDFVNTENKDYRDIYVEETQNSIKMLKRFREAWLRSPLEWDSELFQYADSDFYFYRFVVDRQEKGKATLLINILYRLMEQYELSFEIPNDRRNIPFDFIIGNSCQRIGYTFSEFYGDEDVNGILDSYQVEKACIIRTWKTGRADEWIDRENEQYEKAGIRLESISLKSFFCTYFSAEEYSF